MTGSFERRPKARKSPTGKETSIEIIAIIRLSKSPPQRCDGTIGKKALFRGNPAIIRRTNGMYNNQKRKRTAFLCKIRTKHRLRKKPIRSAKVNPKKYIRTIKLKGNNAKTTGINVNS